MINETLGNMEFLKLLKTAFLCVLCFEGQIINNGTLSNPKWALIESN